MVRRSASVLDSRDSAFASSCLASFSLRSRTERTRSRRKRNADPVTARLSDARSGSLAARSELRSNAQSERRDRGQLDATVQGWLEDAFGCLGGHLLGVGDILARLIDVSL